MTKKWKWILGILIVLLAMSALDYFRQQGFTTSTEALIDSDTPSIARLEIIKGEDSLTLAKIDTVWTILNHDSLQVRKERVKTLLDKLSSLGLGSILSSKREKWSTYSVDDSTGVSLTLYDFSDDTINHFVVGRSKSDWRRNNIRRGNDPNVYQLSGNIISQLQTRPLYWGKKPEPPEPVEPDTTKEETTL
ncbi:MAG: DUF4340 domain-containing protein [Fidelibacterota bacterium]